jgi:hypothetical protein
MASKKLKQALMAGIAGAALAGAAKMKGNALKKAVTDTGDLGSEMANDTALAQATRKAMLPKKKPSMGSSMLDYSSTFGLGPMDGAYKGKMIKAKNGVMARGCKLGRNKRTIIT